MTYCWTCLYTVSHVHILSLPQPSGRTNTQCNTAPKKEQWLIFGKPSISSAEHSESCCLFFECPTHLKRLAFVLKSYETLTWKSIICRSQFVQFFRSLFLIHYFIPVPSGTSLWLDTLRLTSKWRWNNVWDWKRGIHYTSHYITLTKKHWRRSSVYYSHFTDVLEFDTWFLHGPITVHLKATQGWVGLYDTRGRKIAKVQDIVFILGVKMYSNSL